MERTSEWYRNKAMEVANTLQEYRKDTEGWTQCKTNDVCSIFYRDSKEFSGYLYKGEAIINAPPKIVFDFVEPLPDGMRPKWDKAMKKIEIVKQIDKDLRINRACTNSAAKGLISPRDFVDLIIIQETEEYFSTNAISIEGELEEEKKYVRGWNYVCGIIIIKLPNQPNKCQLISLIQPDIKGMVPKKLVDSAIPGSMIEFFTELNKALKENGHIKL